MITKEEFEQRILQNIGLDINIDGFIFDEDTGDTLMFRNKLIKTVNISYGDILYDPLGNPAMMNQLFSYFLVKNEKETNVPIRIISYYYDGNGNSNKKEKGFIEIKSENYELVLKSRSYYNDSLKYADLLFRMNSSIFDEDMSNLDTEPMKVGVR